MQTLLLEFFLVCPEMLTSSKSSRVQSLPNLFHCTLSCNLPSSSSFLITLAGKTFSRFSISSSACQRE